MDVAAAIIQSGYSITAAARNWLKKGFPLAAAFELSHVTAVQTAEDGACPVACTLACLLLLTLDGSCYRIQL